MEVDRLLVHHVYQSAEDYVSECWSQQRCRHSFLNESLFIKSAVVQLKPLELEPCYLPTPFPTIPTFSSFPFSSLLASAHPAPFSLSPPLPSQQYLLVWLNLPGILGSKYFNVTAQKRS